MRRLSLGMTVLLSFIGCATAYPALAQLTISSASWDSGDRRLTVRGTGDENEDVTVRNAYQTTQVLGTDDVEDGEWRVRRSRPSPVPCAVQASAPGDTPVIRAVSNAPSTCSPKAPQQNVCTITVNPTSLAFGNVNVGANAARSTTVTNTGTAACALTVARTGTTELALTTPTTINVAVGGTATVSATYTPSAAGADTGNLAISGSGITTVNVAMTGTGVVVQPQACAITVNPTSLAFGNVNVGANAARSTTVTNTGTAACALTVARTGTTELALTTPTTINVAVGGTATVSATYTPSAAGADTGNLAISGSGITTVNVAMTGTGVVVQPQACAITVNPTSLAFGSVNVGANAARSTTLTNTGTAACALTVARTGTTELALTTPTTINVAVGGTATVSATYTPSAAGADTGNLAISGSGITTVNVAMTGTGVAVQACNPAVDGDHRNCIVGEYTGPEVCVACHESQARGMHSSVHYQQNGPTDFVTNINGNAGEGPAGKPSGVNAVIGINTYCGTHENSPRFTCAGCHVGNGRFPKTPTELTALGQIAQREELANIDCLTCHQETYKRFPDWVLPADGGESYGFSTLTLENVTTDASGNLIPSVGSSVDRTGFAGIPNVDLTTLDFRFRPAGAAGSVIPFPAGAPLPGGAMALTTEEAAKTVHATTRQSCLNCHAGAAGANGAKRGDLSTANIASTDLTLDRHMASNGSNMACSQCHNVDDTPAVNDTGRPTTHHVRGRGLDLRANDVATRFTCDNAGCHNASTVHNNVSNSGLVSAARLTRHTNKVACQTCHIPRYGKGTATEIARDWQEPHVTQTACNGRGGWLPNEIKSSTATPPVPVTPTYQWFDGTSQVYYLTETLTNTPRKALPDTMVAALNMAPGTQAYVMGRPNPNPDNATTRVSGASLAAAKIYPMKEHWGKLARNVSVNAPGVPINSLIPQSTFEFFRTGSFCRSVAEGLGQDPVTAGCVGAQDQEPPDGTEVVAVHTYQTLNHGVEPQANSLGVNSTCGTCHSVNGMAGGPARMDLKGQLGYRVRTTIGWTVNASGNSTCANSCHGSKSGSFTSLHERSQHVQRGCNSCHDQITGR